MANVLTEFKERLIARIPQPEVLLISPVCFFSKRFSLPEGIDPSDVSAFAELSVEGASPFPLEQLYWGFLREAAGPDILVYAVPHPRLRTLGIESIDQAHHAFPAFIALYGVPHGDSLVRSLRFGQTLTLLWLKSDNRLPIHIVSRPLPGSETEPSALFALRDQIIRDTPLQDRSFKTEEAVFELGEQPDLNNGALRFNLRTRSPDLALSEPTEHPLPLSGEAVWNADLRSSDFAQREKANRQRSHLVWNAYCIAAIAVLALILLQGVSWGFAYWNESREQLVESRLEEVAQISARNDTMVRIEEFAQNELSPFAMLDALNNPRPPEVYFTKAAANSFNEIRIDGQSGKITDINRYVDALRRSPLIANIDTRNISTRRNRAVFSIDVTFAGLPAFEIVLPEKEPEETGEPEGQGDDVENNNSAAESPNNRNREYPGSEVGSEPGEPEDAR